MTPKPCSDEYWQQREHWYPPRHLTWKHALCLLALPFVIALLMAVIALAIGVMLIGDGLRKLFKQET